MDFSASRKFSNSQTTPSKKLKHMKHKDLTEYASDQSSRNNHSKTLLVTIGTSTRTPMQTMLRIFSTTTFHPRTSPKWTKTENQPQLNLHCPDFEEKVVHMTHNEVINMQHSRTRINQPTTSLPNNTNCQNNNKTPNIVIDALKNTTTNDSTILLHRSTRAEGKLPPFSIRDSTPLRNSASPITEPFIPNSGNIETNAQT